MADKLKFEPLSEVQRAWQDATARKRHVPSNASKSTVGQPLYHIQREGTLRNTSTDWRAQPELLVKARMQMVTALRAGGITDEVVLAAMAKVPRHIFVDDGFYRRAYDDDALPIGHKQTISHPSIVAKMLSLMREGALRLGGQCDLVLEIGAGCGYQTAVLACIARDVYSIERIESLYRLAGENLTRVAAVLPYFPHFPQLRFGDGLAGWAEIDGFDGIVVAAAGLAIPQTLLEQLRVGGVLVAPMVVDDKKMQQLVRITRVTLRQWQTETLDTVHFVPLLQGTQR